MKSLLKIIYEAKSSDLKNDAESKRKNRSKRTETKFIDAKIIDDKLNIYFESKNKIHGSGINHKQKVLFEDIGSLKDDKSKDNLFELFKNKNIKIDCDCEDFLYKGYKYIGTQKEYSIEKETIAPDVTNPNLDGSVCKHLISVVSKLHLYVDKILEKIK